MRVALISDIHGNSVALDAVLSELNDIDSVLCLGDVAASGPDPSGVITRLAELGVATVMGNTDAGLVDVPSWWHDPSSAGIPQDAHPGISIAVWCSGVISEDEKGFLERLPFEVEVDLGAAGLLVGFHGSPRSYDDIIKPSTPDDEVTAMLRGHDQAVLAGGHTHVPMIRRLGDQTLINPGSVGLPFQTYGYAGGVPVVTMASYAIVEAKGAALSFELRETPIDLVRLQNLVRSTRMPHSDWWLARWTDL